MVVSIKSPICELQIGDMKIEQGQKFEYLSVLIEDRM